MLLKVWRLSLDLDLANEEVFTSSMESMETVAELELERRRELVAEGKSRLLSEDESWERIFK